MFNWFQKLDLNLEVEKIRLYFSKIDLPNWLIYNLPDFIWVFSFTSLLLIIWNMKISKESIIYVLIPLTLALASELGQFFSIVNGTFDKMDLLFYILGGLTSIIIISKSNHKKNENTIITYS